MYDMIEKTQEYLSTLPWWAETSAVAGFVLLAAFVLNAVVKQGLLRLLMKIITLATHDRETGGKLRFIRHFANVVPALVIGAGAGIVPHLSDPVVTVVKNVADAFIILTVALGISDVLEFTGNRLERRRDGSMRAIKGYFQVAKIVIMALAAILMISALLDKSPVILLSGLGAMTAVLMLVFQDTLLSFVASVQISSGDIVRVGDWIEMPHLNADGDVIDISLHTVKVQNWDKTVTTLPTRKLITDPFKNWRGMFESGGRRIKRAIHIDQNSVTFLDEGQRNALRRFALLEDYLDRKQSEIDAWNAELAAQGKEPVNNRRVTNVGTFRAYVQAYLQSHKQIHQGMTLLVRQLQPANNGLPIEIYCFTNDTRWAVYEGIQSDIFDHLLAILPEFGLRVFQDPGGADLRLLAGTIDKNEAKR